MGDLGPGRVVSVVGVIVEGMSKRQVKRALGPPRSRTSTKEFLRGYRTVIGGRNMPNQEHWLYDDHPLGHSTVVTFQRGRVVGTVTRPKE